MFKLYILSVVAVTPLFAYLDPGTGSMLLYFIMGVFATVVYFLKGIVYKIKTFFASETVDKNFRDLSGIDILFYSEGAHYWNVFLPIIEELERLQIHSAYYTSQDNDPALKTSFKYLRTGFVGKDLTAFALLNRIEVKMVVMTTPQLDIMHLKRSKDVDTYVHLVHSPTDALIYKKFAFDYFDTVLCSGEHQIKSIRALEEKRNLPNKLLLETGLTYYDVMYRNRLEHQEDSNKKTVLIAPSWGKNSMLTKYGSSPIETLLNAGYTVILRPHPQMYISQKELIEEIEKTLSIYKNLTIDRAPSGEKSMAISNILLSDFSGIIFDYFFIYEKPIVLIDDEISKGGLEAEDVEHEVWEFKVFKEITTSIYHNNIDQLPEIMNATLNQEISSRVEDLRKEALFNFPQAGEVATEQILTILKGKS